MDWSPLSETVKTLTFSLERAKFSYRLFAIDGCQRISVQNERDQCLLVFSIQVSCSRFTVAPDLLLPASELLSRGFALFHVAPEEIRQQVRADQRRSHCP